MSMFFFLDHQAQPLFGGHHRPHVSTFSGQHSATFRCLRPGSGGRVPLWGAASFLGATTGRMSPLFRDSIRQRSGVSGPGQGAEPRFGAQPLFRGPPQAACRLFFGTVFGNVPVSQARFRGQSPALGRSLFFRGQPSAQHRCFERRGGRRELSASCRMKPGSFSLPLSFGRVGNPPQRKPV